jgi:hypothetical protein
MQQAARYLGVYAIQKQVKSSMPPTVGNLMLFMEKLTKRILCPPAYEVVTDVGTITLACPKIWS